MARCERFCLPLAVLPFLVTAAAPFLGALAHTDTPDAPAPPAMAATMPADIEPVFFASPARDIQPAELAFDAEPGAEAFGLDREQIVGRLCVSSEQLARLERDMPNPFVRGLRAEQQPACTKVRMGSDEVREVIYHALRAASGDSLARHTITTLPALTIAVQAD